MIAGVAPGHILHIVARESKDVIDFTIPATLVHERSIENILRRIHMNPTILMFRVDLEREREKIVIHKSALDYQPNPTQPQFTSVQA